MTDRVNGFTVTLQHDLRIDDVQRIKEAIEMVTGVAVVEPHIVTMEDHMAKAQAKQEIKMKLYKFAADL